MTTAQPPSAPKRSPLKWILAAVVALFICLPITCIGAITVFADDLRKMTGADVDPTTLTDMAAPSPITRRQEGGREVAEVDWTIDSTRPRLRSASIDVRVTVTRHEANATGRAIVLWGDQFGASSELDAQNSHVSVWPALPGRPYAVVVMNTDPPTGAVLECVDVHSEGNPVRWRCDGEVDPSLELRLPPPPPCPEEDWKPLFDVIAPGACFGLTAAQFSTVPLPLIHVQTKTYDDFRAWPKREAGATRFEIPLGKTAEALRLEDSSALTPALFRSVVAALKTKFGEPREAVAGCTKTLHFGSQDDAGAAIRGTLQSCDDAKGDVRKLSLDAWTGRRG